MAVESNLWGNALECLEEYCHNKGLLCNRLLRLLDLNRGGQVLVDGNQPTDR